MSDQVADLLDDAADLLERGGWIQGALEDRGAHCALGALVFADPFNQYRLRARAALAEQVGLNPDRAGNWLANWNDAPLRTRQQVLDTFRAAAKQERMDSGGRAHEPPSVAPAAGQVLPGDAPMSG
jgi:hypothetical protein